MLGLVEARSVTVMTRFFMSSGEIPAKGRITHFCEKDEGGWGLALSRSCENDARVHPRPPRGPLKGVSRDAVASSALADEMVEAAS